MDNGKKAEAARLVGTINTRLYRIGRLMQATRTAQLEIQGEHIRINDQLHELKKLILEDD